MRLIFRCRVEAEVQPKSSTNDPRMPVKPNDNSEMDQSESRSPSLSVTKEENKRYCLLQFQFYKKAIEVYSHQIELRLE